jgi:hypothetical protein
MPTADRPGGDDAAFLGYGSQKQGLFKRVNGGALQNVVDNTTPVPDSGSDVFKIIYESGIALANGQVLFAGQGQYTLRGVYTDIGGALSVLFDNEIHNTIVAGGVTLTINSFNLSTRSFAYTPQGYMMVFRLDLPSGQGSAIVRATINAGSGTSNGTFTVRKDFSDNNTASVSITLTCTSGTVTNKPATGAKGSRQYSASAAPWPAQPRGQRADSADRLPATRPIARTAIHSMAAVPSSTRRTRRRTRSPCARTSATTTRPVSASP